MVQPRVEPKVKTTVAVEAAGGARSKVTVTTTDRPGLLMDIVRNLKDLSLNVVSAEIDTVGPKAYDVIYVTYQAGSPRLFTFTPRDMKPPSLVCCCQKKRKNIYIFPQVEKPELVCE